MSSFFLACMCFYILPNATPNRSSKREFSNDPTKNMQELANVFQSRVSWIQNAISKLKAESEMGAEVCC